MCFYRHCFTVRAQPRPLKNPLMDAMFTLTILKILPFEGRSVLSPSQRGTESERVKFSVKHQKIIRLFLKLLEK